MSRALFLRAATRCPPRVQSRIALALPCPPPHLPPRSLHTTAPRLNINNYNLAGLRPATKEEEEEFQRRTPKGFGRAHGVATSIRPVAFDPLPPINSRGGRDVNGWRTIYEGVVEPNWSNIHGTMHGGCAAWLTDNLTGRATEDLGTDTWWHSSGMSITLDMTYFSPAFIGDRVTILVTAERMSGNVAHMRCDIFNAQTGDRVASGNHVLMMKKKKT